MIRPSTGYDHYYNFITFIVRRSMLNTGSPVVSEGLAAKIRQLQS